jgi:hypothetical protein
MRRVEKVCSACGETKEIELFYRDKKSKDGYYNKCKSCKDDKTKRYIKENKEKISEYRRKYYEANREKILAYRNENRESFYKKNNEYRSKRRKNDPGYRMLNNLRTRIHRTIKWNRKTDSTMVLVGCSIEHLKAHLERQFADGMTFDNYGEWEIDHIRPCSMFDLSKPEEQLECFNYKNLQPLWAEDNRRKSNKLGW